VAGGMITAKRSSVSSIHGDDNRVILSLPADLADQLMSGELFAGRRDEVEIRRVSAGRARDIVDSIDG
jgi:sulfate adenylyltransferase subunit 1